VEPADPLDRHDRTLEQPRWLASSTSSLPATSRRPTTSSLPGATSRSRGPQSGQASGCAWKRRSVGSWYSLSHGGHSGNPAIVVAGTVVGQRGDDGEPRSAVGAGGERVAVPPVRRVVDVVQAGGAGRRVGGCAGHRTRGPGARVDDEPRLPEGLDRFGDHALEPGERRRLVAQAPDELVERAAAPSTSMVTPAVPLRTEPLSPSPVASRCTWGRNPTPWTVPVTAIRTRCTGSVVSVVLLVTLTPPCRGCRHVRQRRSRPRVSRAIVGATRPVLGGRRSPPQGTEPLVCHCTLCS
jgi:hypothetical protein